MSRVIYFIIQLVIFLFIISSFSNGVVYFIKNINKDDDFLFGSSIDTSNNKFVYYYRTV